MKPPSWKGDYQAEIWASLESIGQMVAEHEVTAVLDGGDFFHIKAPSRNSHALTRRTAVIHGKYKCPIYSVIGNHDIVYNDLSSLDRQPLGVMFASKVFHCLEEQVFKDGDLQVRVVGVHYSLHRTLDDLLEIKKKPGDTFLVAVVHALATENPPTEVEGFFKEPVFCYSDLVTPDGPDLWCLGHWHQDQGIVNIKLQSKSEFSALSGAEDSEIKGKYFVNQGAVSRGALNHDNISRIPQVALLEFEPSGIKVKTIPLKVAPAEEVFDFEKKERIESENRSIDRFIERLQEDATFDPTATIEKNIQALDFAAEVRDMALAYLERARETS
jgi:DNA repair exonuclease SbcCD nuclease subunit